MSVLLQQQDLLSRLRRYPSYWPIGNSTVIPGCVKWKGGMNRLTETAKILFQYSDAI